MGPTLEDIKGRNGSIKIGATGKVSALMMKELDPTRATPNPSISTNRKPRKTVPVTVSCSVSTKRPQPRITSSSTASSSGGSTSNSIRRKIDTVHRIPMLASEDVSVDKTPERGISVVKRTHIVEIVDLSCGNSERAWSNRLKKLSFSRLSD